MPQNKGYHINNFWKRLSKRALGIALQQSAFHLFRIPQPAFGRAGTPEELAVVGEQRKDVEQAGRKEDTSLTHSKKGQWGEGEV